MNTRTPATLTLTMMLAAPDAASSRPGQVATGRGTMLGMCPMDVVGTQVVASKLEGGIAVDFTTTGDAAELRKRVAHRCSAAIGRRRVPSSASSFAAVRTQGSLTIMTTRSRAAPGWASARVFALGHSVRPIEQFLELLRSNGVAILADIRTIPRSRHNPQFDQAALRASIEQAGFRYVHLKSLGGLRRSIGAASPNGAWRNASFRGYADYMQTDEFAEGMRELRGLAVDGPTAILCAEGNPHRCHRSLVCDALFARGVVARHVTGRGRSKPHEPTSFAKIDGRRVTYPARRRPRRGAGA